VRLRLVEPLEHVEQRSDLRVDLRGDEELPLREREGLVQLCDAGLHPLGHQLLLRGENDGLHLLEGAPGEEEVGTGHGDERREGRAVPRQAQAEEEQQERDDRCGQADEQVVHGCSDDQPPA